MERLALGVALVCAVFVVGACGFQESDEDQIRKVNAEFVGAMEDRDFKAVCDLMAPRLKRQFEANGFSCVQVFQYAASLPQYDEVVEKAKDIKSISVNGGSAIIYTAAQQQPTLLKKVGGEWLVIQTVN